jgi:hypothetical protein
MMYSDHDDRRSPEKRGGRSSSPNTWKHDLWDSIKDAPPKEKPVDRKPTGECAAIAVGLRVRNVKTNRKGEVSEVEEGSDKFQVKFDDGDEHWRPIINFEAEDGRSLTYAAASKEKSRKDEKDDSGSEGEKDGKDEDKKSDAKEGDDKDGKVDKDEKEEKASKGGDKEDDKSGDDKSSSEEAGK